MVAAITVVRTFCRGQQVRTCRQNISTTVNFEQRPVGDLDAAPLRYGPSC